MITLEFKKLIICYYIKFDDKYIFGFSVYKRYNPEIELNVGKYALNFIWNREVE